MLDEVREHLKAAKKGRDIQGAAGKDNDEHILGPRRDWQVLEKWNRDQ